MKTEYSIGQVSHMYNLSLKTLRYYDQLGLLKPSRRDEQTGYRYYDESVTIRLGSIRYYQSTGLSLEEIRDFIFSENLDELIQKFQEDSIKRENEIQNTIIQRDAMEAWLHLLEEGKMYIENNDTAIGIRRMKEIKTFFSYDYKSLHAAASEAKQITYGEIYVEYPSVAKRIAGEAQPFIRHMEIHPLSCRNIRTTTLGGFTAVRGIHIGTRENIDKTYENILAWCGENEFFTKDGAVERNIIDETSVDREADFVTEILIPIKE